MQATVRELLRRLTTAPARPSSLAFAHHATAALFPPNGLALFYAPWYTLYHYLGSVGGCCALAMSWL
jgi:hypothetical protein